MAKKAKKAAKKQAKAEPMTDAQALEHKRMLAIKNLGIRIQSKEAELSKQESICATAKGKLEEEREIASDIRKELDEDRDELTKLAVGGHSERLFSPVAETGAKTDGPAAGVKDKVPTLAQREKELAGVSLKDLGIAGAQLDKLEADGIHNGDDLRKWLNKVPPAKIAGIGDAAREKLGDALSAWWMSHPFEDASKTSTKPAAATDKASADRVIVGKIEIIASIPDTFSVYIAPRESGKLCFGFWIKSKSLPNLGEFEQDYFGHYEADNRAKLYADAFDACTEKVKEMEGGGLVGPREREMCAKIHGAIIEAGKLIHKKTKKAASEESVSLSFAGA